MKDKILKLLEWYRPIQVCYERNHECGIFWTVEIAFFRVLEFEVYRCDDIYRADIGLCLSAPIYYHKHMDNNDCFLWPKYDDFVGTRHPRVPLN
jgi:hypothetical protein